MPRHRRMCALLVCATIGGLTWPDGGIARDSPITVGYTIAAAYPAPQLAVGARGDAVVAWVASGYIRGAKLGGDTAPMVFAALRGAGRGFSRARRISEPTRGVRSFAAAIGPAGDTAIVWEPDAVRSADLRVSRGHAGGRLGAPHAIPGTAGARAPDAAIDARGRLLVAWLRSGPDRCGSLVMASVARSGGRFGRPRRVSERCAHATLVRVALARDGDGVVAWRSEGAHAVASNSRVRVSAYAGGRLVAPSHRVDGAEDRSDARGRGRRPPRAGRLARRRSGGRPRPRAGADGSGQRLGRRTAHRGPGHARSGHRRRRCRDERRRCRARGLGADAEADVRALCERARRVAVAGGPPLRCPVRLSRNIDDAGVGVALDGAGRGIAGYAGDRLRRMRRGGRWGAELALDPPRPEDDENDFAPEPERLRVGVSNAGEVVAMWLSSTDDSDAIRVRVLRAPSRR